MCFQLTVLTSPPPLHPRSNQVHHPFKSQTSEFFQKFSVITSCCLAVYQTKKRETLPKANLFLQRSRKLERTMALDRKLPQKSQLPAQQLIRNSDILKPRSPRYRSPPGKVRSLPPHQPFRQLWRVNIWEATSQRSTTHWDHLNANAWPSSAVRIESHSPNYSEFIVKSKKCTFYEMKEN